MMLIGEQQSTIYYYDLSEPPADAVHANAMPPLY